MEPVTNANASIKHVLAKSPEKWLEMAASKDKKRKWLHQVYGNIASDGIRMHRDNDKPCTAPADTMDRFNIILDQRKGCNNQITAPRDSLILACLRAIAIGKASNPKYDFIPSLRLTINERLEYMARSEENGETSGYIAPEDGYTHSGPNLTIAFDPHYLAEALGGMGETVTISLHTNKHPTFITDGHREAILMPVNLG